MRIFVYIFLLCLISCIDNSQESKVDLSTANINYQEVDKETGWQRVLLKNPVKWGFVSKEGHIKIPFIYDFVNPFVNGLTYAKNGNAEFFITVKNLKLVGDYDAVRIFTFGLAPVSKNKKWGFIDETGKVAIPIQYDEVEYFTKNNLSAVTNNGKSGFINKNGTEVVPIIYERVKSEQLDDLVIVRKDHKWAFFNNQGKQLTDFLYADVQRTWKGDDTTFFENGPASVRQNGKYLYLNKNLKPAFPKLVFDSATSFDSNRNAIVINNGKFGILKNDGRIAVPIQFGLIENFNSNGNPHPKYYFLSKGKINILLNKNLTKIAETRNDIYEHSFIVQNNLVSFKNFKDKYGLVNSEGKEIIPFLYDEPLYFEGQDFSIATRNKKFGIINLDHKSLIPFKYSAIGQLDSDDKKVLFKASDESGEAIIDLGGKVILDGYASIQSIFNVPLKFIVEKNNKFGIVDVKNNIILPLVYDEISDWTEYGPRHSKFIVKNGKTGLIDDKSFKVTIPPVYDKFLFVNGLIFVKKNDKSGIITEEGKLLCNFLYDEIYPSSSDFMGYGQNNNRIYARKGNSYFQINETGKILKTNLTEKFVKENSEVLPPPPPPKEPM